MFGGRNGYASYDNKRLLISFSFNVMKHIC